MRISPKTHTIKLRPLKKRRDFLRARKEGLSAASSSLVIQTNKQSDLEEKDMARIGFTVSKHIDKRAVRRNRVKRRLRAAAQDVLGHKARPGHDYVIIARKRALTGSYDQLKNDIERCLRHICNKKS